MDETRENTAQEQEVELVVTLLDGNGGQYEATVLNSFMVNNKQYISVLPVMPDENGDFPIILFAANFTETGDNEVQMEITSIPEAEYPAIAEYYEKNILPLDMEK